MKITKFSCIIFSFICIFLTACGNTASSNESSLFQNSDHNSVRNQASEKILNAKAWSGTVQIEDIIVESYGDTTLKEFEDAGFAIEEDSYDNLAVSEELTLTKEGVQIELKISRDETSPSIYRDCKIAYVSSISFLEQNEECHTQVWVHDGIKMGESIDQLTQKYDTVRYDANNKIYKLHPISFVWERSHKEAGYFGEYDIELNYEIDSDQNFVRYELLAADSLKTLSKSIPYQTERLDEFEGTCHATFDTPIGAERSAGNSWEGYRFCTDGNNGAKYLCNVNKLKKINPSECEVAYETDQYIVYREVNVAYLSKQFSILKKDPKVNGYGIAFRLDILDSDGYIVTGNLEPLELTVYGYQKYELEEGQKYLDFSSYSNSSNVPYAHTVAIDIFDHLSQYTVKPGLADSEF